MVIHRVVEALNIIPAPISISMVDLAAEMMSANNQSYDTLVHCESVID